MGRHHSRPKGLSRLFGAKSSNLFPVGNSGKPSWVRLSGHFTDGLLIRRSQGIDPGRGALHSTGLSARKRRTAANIPGVCRHDLHCVRLPAPSIERRWPAGGRRISQFGRRHVGRLSCSQQRPFATNGSCWLGNCQCGINQDAAGYGGERGRLGRVREARCRLGWLPKANQAI